MIYCDRISRTLCKMTTSKEILNITKCISADLWACLHVRSYRDVTILFVNFSSQFFELGYRPILVSFIKLSLVVGSLFVCQHLPIMRTNIIILLEDFSVMEDMKVILRYYMLSFWCIWFNNSTLIANRLVTDIKSWYQTQKTSDLQWHYSKPPISDLLKNEISPNDILLNKL